jgi:vacuolar-type H+-ATPase subunit E/Vma4
MTAAAAAAELAPARARMLRDAADQAARILADARREADGIAAQARQDAERTVSLARAAGHAQAVLQAAAMRRRARSDARSALLGAQREAYDELRARVRVAVDGLRSEPGYDRLLEALARMARLEAGPGATVTASEDGGVVARSPGVLVDYSLPRLADLAVEALDGEVRELWAP